MEMKPDQTKTMLTRFAPGIVQQEHDTKLSNQVRVSVLHPTVNGLRFVLRNGLSSSTDAPHWGHFKPSG